VPDFILSKISDRADYVKAFITFAASGLFLFLSLLTLPMVIVSPQKFTMLFTLAMISLLFALAFLNGPLSYVKKMTTDRKNLIASSVMVVSIVFSLYFSVISSSYLLSLLFCFLEVRLSCLSNQNSSTQLCYSFAIPSQWGRLESSEAWQTLL
jgi:hypothetical protein